MKDLFYKLRYLFVQRLFPLLMIAGQAVSAAQDYPAVFEGLSIEEGLSQSRVRCILQDSDGFLWFGTREGLNRYDGYEFKVFKRIPAQPNSLTDNLILSICEDDSGFLWVGTGMGLNKLERRSGNVVRYNADLLDSCSLSNDYVMTIAMAMDGDLWIGTAWGLLKFDRATGKFKRHFFRATARDSADWNRIWALYPDSSGHLWIGTDAGVLRLYPGASQYRRYSHDPANSRSLSSNAVRAIVPDPAGSLWIGTHSGLNRMDPETGVCEHFFNQPRNPGSLSQNRVKCLAMDRQGELWVGTEWGLNRFEPLKGRFTHYYNNPVDPYSLSNNFISTIYEDRSGILWIGTYHAGVDKYVPFKQVFRSYGNFFSSSANGLTDKNVLAVIQSRDGQVWLGTYSGLYRWDPADGSHERFGGGYPASGLWGDFVRCITEDSRGALWVGTYQSDRSGLNRLDRAARSFRHYLHDPGNPMSLSNNDVTAVCEDRDGRLLIGTDGGGLNILDPRSGRFEHFITNYSDTLRIAGNWITCIFQDRRGRIWIGTDHGLSLLQPGAEHFTNFVFDPRDTSGLSGNKITMVYEDLSDRIWIGTEDGLNLFEDVRGRFKSYTKNNGLPSAVIYGILEDSDGYLWLSTGKGLSQFNPVRETFRNFDESDGLGVSDYNIGACCRLRTGELVFGGKTGFVVFDPRDIKPSRTVPPVVITDFKKMNTSIDLGDLNSGREISIRRSEDVLSFEFAALDFNSPAKNQYAYRMEGFDRQWIYSGERRFANYTNLDPGHYIFRVKGANVYGVWNENGTSLRIRIIPSFFQTVWFKLLCVLAGAGVLGLLYHLRTEQQRQRQLDLERKIGERTRELAEKNLELKKSQEEYQALYDQAPVCYHELDLSGRIRRINHTEAEMLGYKPEEMLGRLIFEFISPDEVDGAKDNFFNRVTKRDIINAYDRKYVRKDGKPVYFSIRSRLIRDEAIGANVVRSALQDVTDLKLLEDQLLQSQKMEAIGRLAGGVAHDFNNLLTVIRGHLSLLLTELPQAHPMRKELALIDQAGEKAEKLTRQLLAFSRKQQMRPEIVNLNQLIRNIHTLVDRLIGEDIRLELMLQDDLGIICVDPIQIEQIIMNLAANARDAMPNGGLFHIETRNVLLDNAYAEQHIDMQPGSYVQLSVSDTGVGMDIETRTHLFEPFFTTKEKSKGTGLGLPMVYGIVKQSNGSIHVYSEPGSGTTFKIYFPSVEGKPVELRREEKKAEIATGTETVLVIEDDDYVRRFTCRVLAKFGYRVLEARDHASAVQACENAGNQVDLIISDVIMPGKNGPEIIRHLSRIIQGVKVLYMSGYHDNLISHHGVLDPGVHFIQKPFTLSQMTSKIREVLGGEAKTS